MDNVKILSRKYIDFHCSCKLSLYCSPFSCVMMMYIRRPDCYEPMAVIGWCGHLHLQVWSLPLTSAAHNVASTKAISPLFHLY